MPGRPEHSGLCDDDVAPQGETPNPRPQVNFFFSTFEQTKWTHTASSCGQAEIRGGESS